MNRYELTNTNRELIEIGLDVLKRNYDEGIYNHTVGCAVLYRKEALVK